MALFFFRPFGECNASPVAEDLKRYIGITLRINEQESQYDSLCARLNTTPSQQYSLVYLWRDASSNEVTCGLRKSSDSSNGSTIFLDAELLLILENDGWKPLKEQIQKGAKDVAPQLSYGIPSRRI